MLKIRDFARLAEVSMATPRYYDEIGLLKPIRAGPETGYRFYTMDQLPHLHRSQIEMIKCSQFRRIHRTMPNLISWL